MKDRGRWHIVAGGVFALVASLVLTSGCRSKVERYTKADGATVEVWSEEAGPDTLRLFLREGTVTESVPVKAPYLRDPRRTIYRDGWVVAECHMNPSSGMFAAWRVDPLGVYHSPGYAWVVNSGHFISFHKVHLNPPPDPRDNCFLYVDGVEAPEVTELPDSEDGSCGAFFMRLARTDHGDVYRLSFPDEVIWDSSFLLWRRPNGQWDVLGFYQKDCGGRYTVSYYSGLETEYSVNWADGVPVVHVRQVAKEGQAGMPRKADGSLTWRWSEGGRAGTLTSDGVAWEDVPESYTQVARVADSADQVRGLGVGQQIPAATVRSVDGQPVDLRQTVAKQPTILIFYRGGWCPYCNRHLAELKELEPTLKEMGYQIVAISPDRPEELSKSIDAHQLTYTLLSDSDSSAARGFGLAFRMPDELVVAYRRDYGIDIESASGWTHHELPVPAAYVVDRSGKIRFAFVNPDYKVRVDSEEMLAAAKTALND